MLGPFQTVLPFSSQDNQLGGKTGVPGVSCLTTHRQNTWAGLRSGPSGVQTQRCDAVAIISKSEMTHSVELVISTYNSN